MKKNILLTIEYDGSSMKGWQKQEGQTTVQETLENALEKSLGERVVLEATGRTDAGVHAYGQCASFFTESGLPVNKIMRVTNNFLNVGERVSYPMGSIRVVDVKEVAEDFHARFSCIGKTYVYRLVPGDDVDIFKRSYCYNVKKDVDVGSMQEAVKKIIGKKDFACFQAAGGTPRKTTVRTIFDARILESGGELILVITGDGFLYNMVRIITGTLVDVGLGKIKPEEIDRMIEKKDRTLAGHTAPPTGLYLYKIYFDEGEMREWIDRIGMNTSWKWRS